MSTEPLPPARSALERWGRAVAHRPGRVVLVWVLLVLLSFAGALGVLTGQGLFDRVSTGEITAPGEAAEAGRLATEARGTALATDTLIVEGSSATDPFVRQAVGRAVQRIDQTEGVASVVNPLVVPDGVKDPRVAPLVRDEGGGRYGFVTIVEYEDGLDEEDLRVARRDVATQLDQIVTGSWAKDSQRGSVTDLVDRIVSQVGTDLARGEGVALPISFAVMVLVFGGFLAAGLPLAGAIASIGGALASLLGFSYITDLDATVVNIVTVLGLGLCIDYGLLVVSRFREEARGALAGRPASSMDRDEVVLALGRTVDQAGRTVIFSAVTVAISLSGLLLIPVDFLRASGMAGMAVVLLALVVAVTLIPALCSLGSRRILRRGTEVAPEDGVFSRLAGGVQRAPWVVIAAVLGVLITLALPALRLQLTTSGPELLRSGTPERTFFETYDELYPDLANPDVIYVTTAPKAEVQAWVDGAARDLPGLASPPTISEVGAVDGQEVRLVELRTGDSSLGGSSRDLVRELHEHRPPIEGYIGGQAAGLHDFLTTVQAHAPPAIGVVVLATFVLLFLMTGSVVIPLKALFMNVVSLGASLGALVWVFQDGHLSGLLGFTSTGAVEAAIPILALAFGFGLSMDYEVFLLARIVELHDSGASTDRAVGLGLQRSGRVITSAALLMVIVFSGFITAEVLAIQQTGVALVLAIAIDATLVRMLLVPATMSVLGEWNWWAPAWMARLHRRFGITEAGRAGDTEAGRAGDTEAGRAGDTEAGRAGDTEAGRAAETEAVR